MLQHLGVGRQLIGQCSDLDTAEAVAQDEENPWPEEIKLAVWADRVSLRKKLKQRKQMCAPGKFQLSHLTVSGVAEICSASIECASCRFQQFWSEHVDIFLDWFQQLPLDLKREACTIPTAEFRAFV